MKRILISIALFLSLTTSKQMKKIYRLSHDSKYLRVYFEGFKNPKEKTKIFFEFNEIMTKQEVDEVESYFEEHEKMMNIYDFIAHFLHTQQQGMGYIYIVEKFDIPRKVLTDDLAMIRGFCDRDFMKGNVTISGIRYPVKTYFNKFTITPLEANFIWLFTILNKQ